MLGLRSTLVRAFLPALILVLSVVFSGCSATKPELSLSNPLGKPQPTATPQPVPVNGETYAFIQGNNVWLHTNNQDHQLTEDGQKVDFPKSSTSADIWYLDPRLLDDKTLIVVKAFKRQHPSGFGDELVRVLIKMDLTTRETTELANTLTPSMSHYQISLDKRFIYYSAPIDQQNFSDKLGVYKVDVQNPQAFQVGTFTVISGCGGYIPDPADQLVANENIQGLGAHSFVFSETTNKLVFSSSCASLGLSVLDTTTQQVTVIDGAGHSASLSPDQKQLAFVKNNQIVLYDLEKNTLVKTFFAPVQPRTLMWADNYLFFTSVSPGRRRLRLSDSLALSAFGSTSIEFSQNAATAWMLDLSKNTFTSLLNENDAHELKPVLYNPTTQDLYLSLVTNSNDVYQHVLKNKNLVGAESLVPRVKLIKFNLGTKAPRGELRNDAQYAWVK